VARRSWLEHPEPAAAPGVDVAGWVELPVEAGEVVVGAEVAGPEVVAGGLVDDGADALEVELAEQPAASASTASAGVQASRRRVRADGLVNHASLRLEESLSVHDTWAKRVLVPRFQSAAEDRARIEE
jgi:hypothetical protein